MSSRSGNIKKIKIFSGEAQDIGARGEQQDAFGVGAINDDGFLPEDGVLAVVADGMGGLAEGDRASKTAVENFFRSYSRKSSEEGVMEALERSLVETNEAVHKLGLEIGEEQNFGTTLVAAVIHESGLYWIYSGDSRIYITDGQALTQLTEDQVYGRKLDSAAAKGLIDYESARLHPDREALTSYIGDREINEIGKGHQSGPLPGRLSLLLCTDGLFKFIPEKKILDCFTDDPEEWTKRLIDAVIKENNPAQDNITAVCLAIREDVPKTVKTVKTRTRRKRRQLIVYAVSLLLAFLAAGLFFLSGRFMDWTYFWNKPDSHESTMIVSKDVAAEGDFLREAPKGEKSDEFPALSEDHPPAEELILAVPVTPETRGKTQQKTNRAK